MTPAITIAIYEDGWEVSTHLQVGARTFRYFSITLSQLEDVSLFLARWSSDWNSAANEYFAYEGLEDMTEPVIHEGIALALANLLPKSNFKRRF